MVDIPKGYETLLERPLYGHLATTRPDGNAQVNPMWFDCYLEVRGVVEEIVPDPTGAFYLHLNDRYTGPLTEPPVDKADRVILVVRPTGYSKQ